MGSSSRKFPALLRTIVAKTLKRSGIEASLERHSIVHKWDAIVPAAVSSHARAVRVSGSTLHVEVDSSAWMHELAVIKHVLLQKVNEGLGPGTSEIKDLRFQQRSWKKVSHPIHEDPEPPRAGEQDIRTAKKLLEPIRDEGLRSVMERILEKDRKLKWRRKT